MSRDGKLEDQYVEMLEEGWLDRTKASWGTNRMQRDIKKDQKRANKYANSEYGARYSKALKAGAEEAQTGLDQQKIENLLNIYIQKANKLGEELMKDLTKMGIAEQVNNLAQMDFRKAQEADPKFAGISKFLRSLNNARMGK